MLYKRLPALLLLAFAAGTATAVPHGGRGDDDIGVEKLTFTETATQTITNTATVNSSHVQEVTVTETATAVITLPASTESPEAEEITITETATAIITRTATTHHSHVQVQAATVTVTAPAAPNSHATDGPELAQPPPPSTLALGLDQGGWQAIVAKWRVKLGLPSLKVDSRMVANADATGRYDNGNMVSSSTFFPT